MQIKLTTPFGENIFEMETENALEIIKKAFEYSAEIEKKEFITMHRNSPLTPLFDEVMSAGNVLGYAGDENVTEVKKNCNIADTAFEVPQRKERHSRNESLFGEGWKCGNAEKTVDDEQRDFGKFMEGYKGFLYIKCPKCGKIKGFCTKEHTKEHRCECGEKIRLENLKPMYAKCQCGKQYKYYTNMDEDSFEYSCLNCGAPIDITINSRKNAFVTLGANARGGGIFNNGGSFGMKSRANYYDGRY